MVNVNVTGGEMSQAEINSYIDRAQKLYPEKTIQTMLTLIITLQTCLFSV